jgi:hypothetical protein
VKHEERCANGERQDQASRDLIKRSVDVFEGIVAEAAASISGTVMALVQDMEPNLSPTTLRLTVGTSPCTICLSKCKGTINKLAA